MFGLTLENDDSKPQIVKLVFMPRKQMSLKYPEKRKKLKKVSAK
jgi:hypothetical protein